MQYMSQHPSLALVDMRVCVIDNKISHYIADVSHVPVFSALPKIISSKALV